MSIQQLEPMTFPLHGQRLIEASAGTGKTFTIAGLYLRLLLGHGTEETSHATPLNVDQILVVTFTSAATQELRDRIRARIHDARIAFGRGRSKDPVIKPLLSEVSDHKQAEIRLLDAERQMDEAAIYTIHGFCQRMLTQNAFESGSLFTNEFITDESEIQERAIADFWRIHFSPLPKSLVGVISDYWKLPKALLSHIRTRLSGADIKIIAPPMPADLIAHHDKNVAKIEAVKALWRQAILDDVDQIISKSGLNGNSYRAASVAKWLDEMAAWANSATMNYRFPDNIERFAASTLAEKTKKGGKTPVHSAFDAIDDLLASNMDMKSMLMAYAIVEVRKLLEKEKQRFGKISFDDLLSHLANALEKDAEGLLAERIRQLYPVAMIDEFQDTDPLQYQVFSTIYGSSPHTGLFMIGDPKQAIYAFRGADIFTYIHARRQVTDHYNLGTNWRSSAETVQAVNRIFQFAKSPFVYDKDIPFEPVEYSPGSDQRYWQIDGVKQAAMTFWLNPTTECISNGDYQEDMATATANSIRHLLEKSLINAAHFCKGDSCHPVNAGDIAVLVRTGAEASLIRRKLARHGIASVYLSDRNSVFTGGLAKDILRVLNAVLMPDDERMLKAALASDLLALDAIALDQLNHDEKAWELAVLEFSQYQALWFSRGVLPMLRQFMKRRGVAERLLADEQGGERTLTDLLHIGELLQEASLTLDSHFALTRWLNEHIENPNGNSDQQQVRLESERDLVQIVTIHKSKGLEYDLVYLPFVCSYRPANSPFYHDDKHDAILDLIDSEQAVEKAEIERIAEDLRLIYVALTRPVYGCIIGLAPVKTSRGKSPYSDIEKSAFGFMLQACQAKEATELQSCVEALISGFPFMEIAPTPDIIEGRIQFPAKDTSVIHAKKFTIDITRDGGMTSYSALVKQGHEAVSALPVLASFDTDALDEQEPELSEDVQQIVLAPYSSIFQFPRGARAGTFLHTLFEKVPFHVDMYSESVVNTFTRLLTMENYPVEWVPMLQQLLTDVVSQPLKDENFVLRNTQSRKRTIEMEFIMPVEKLQSGRVNRLLKKHDALSSQAGDLNFDSVSGVLKGFVDLIFQWEGRYYVLDWKSNHLGEAKENYAPEKLARAMIEHRYDFQYQIYSLALHRYLSQRKADYDYESDFGGVFYIFLRGIETGTSNGIFYTKPSFELINGLDELFTNEDVHNAVK